MPSQAPVEPMAKFLLIILCLVLVATGLIIACIHALIVVLTGAAT